MRTQPSSKPMAFEGQAFSPLCSDSQHWTITSASSVTVYLRSSAAMAALRRSDLGTTSATGSARSGSSRMPQLHLLPMVPHGLGSLRPRQLVGGGPGVGVDARHLPDRPAPVAAGRRDPPRLPLPRCRGGLAGERRLCGASSSAHPHPSEGQRCDEAPALPVGAQRGGQRGGAEPAGRRRRPPQQRRSAAQRQHLAS